MKKIILTFTFIFSMLFAMYLPIQAKDINKTSVNSNTSLNLSSDVRYVRIRGKRYKVWYKTYYKKGKRYYRILKVRRA
ncbi:MAG: hypothetical protein MUC29_09240 [Pyrinomonadaceae bacterium]|jgi:hypothetical protein|nr:hypothetical protein [Pyrinomonadaceae bacterium]